MIEESGNTLVEAMRARQSVARYPHLLEGPGQSNAGVLYHRTRSQSSLQIIAVRHDALSEAQLGELGEFRLQQYTLWEYYDAGAIQAGGFMTDPALAQLPPGTVHVFAGLPDGTILAYFFWEPATVVGAPGVRQRILRRLAEAERQGTPLRMSEADRPLFPSEYDTFSPDVYTSLPLVRDADVRQVRELARLLRNRAIRTPLGNLAAIETISALAQLTIHSGDEIRILLGNMGSQARRLMDVLGLPILYAPLVPVSYPEPDQYWVKGVNAAGRFQPFVISGDHVRAYAWYYGELDHLLEGPLLEVKPALQRFHALSADVQPEQLLPDSESCSVFWTIDSLYSERASSTQAERPAPIQAARRDLS